VRGAIAAAGHRPHGNISRMQGLVLLVAITVIWGVNWSAVKLAVDELPVLTFSTLRLVIGGFGMLIVCRLGGLSLRVPRRELGPLLVLAFFNVTMWHVCAAFGVSYLASGRAAILAFTMPLWAALLAVPVLGERLGWNILFGLVIGLAAVGVLVAPDWRAIAASPLGILLMLVAAFSWAAGTVYYKRVRWTMSTAVLTGWQILIGGIPVALAALWFDGGFEPGRVSLVGWLSTLFAASLPTLFCQWAWFKIVDIFPAGVAAISTLAIPVIGVITGTLALGEALGPEVLGSLVLVIASLCLVLLVPTRRRRPAG
jgi:drug/metabolite transporter (DMT)-like permease